MSEVVVQIQLRLPATLAAKLPMIAKKHHRSLSGEIIVAIEEWIRQEAEQDLLPLKRAFERDRLGYMTKEEARKSCDLT